MSDKQTVQTLKGFRDFLPLEKRQRDYVMKKVIEVFENYGFEPLETPTLEYASLLLGKYGKEADKLVYTFEDRGQRKIGLRYDQTVPIARVLTQYQNQLPKFFRRYQIQNVFRADKPQQGRYREFTQCDIDIFGCSSPLADAEIIACTYDAFKNIGFQQVQLKINDRQTLFTTLKPFVTEQVNIFSLIQSIDKLDKISPEKVIQELVSKGLAQKKAQEALSAIKQSQESVNLKQIIQNAISLGVKAKDLIFTPTIARGLDYYTGMIFEVSLPDYPVGSCGGGGRYDQLIEKLGGINIPAVGIAFGFDRMVGAADQLGLIPIKDGGTQVLVTIFDQQYLEQSLQITKKLRQAKIKSEIYPNPADKIAKQFKLANQKNIPWVLIIGEEEIAQNQLSLKNMISGEQSRLTFEELIKKIQKS